MINSRATQKLRERAKTRGLLLPQLADELDVPWTTMQGWLYYGKIPNSRAMAKLASAGAAEPNDWFLPPDAETPAAAPQAAE